MLYGIFYITLFFALLSSFSTNKMTNKLVYKSTILILIVFCGLRDPFIYPDNISYYEFYIGDFSAADEGTLNIGYLFFNWLMGIILPHFQCFCFVVSIIIICSYSKVITLYSPYIWLSLLLYVLINYLPSFFLLRQYLSMPFVFLSFKYVIERKPRKFGLSVLLAFSIHTTALIVLPLYYLYGLKYSKKNLFLIFVATIVASLGFMAVGAIIGRLFPYYSQYVDMTVEEPAWERALMKCYILGVFIFALKKEFYKSGINRLIFFAMLMNVIICIGAMNIFGVFRLREFFSLADFIGVPIIFSYIPQMRYPKKHVVSFLTIIYIILLVISYISFVNGGNMEEGYRLFWENEAYPSK